MSAPTTTTFPSGLRGITATDCDGREWSAILLPAPQNTVSVGVKPTLAERRRPDWSTRTEPLPYEGDALWAQFAANAYDGTEADGLTVAARLINIALTHIANQKD